MSVQLIKFVRRCDSYNPGEVAGFSQARSQELIAAGYGLPAALIDGKIVVTSEGQAVNATTDPAASSADPSSLTADTDTDEDSKDEDPVAEPLAAAVDEQAPVVEPPEETKPKRKR